MRRARAAQKGEGAGICFCLLLALAVFVQGENDNYVVLFVGRLVIYWYREIDMEGVGKGTIVCIFVLLICFSLFQPFRT